MSYFLSAEAEDELTQAIAFYAERASKAVAVAFLAAFERPARLVAVNPGIGTPTLGRRRLFPLHRFPYSLVYRIDEAEVRISAVAHQRRRPGYWRGRA